MVEKCKATNLLSVLFLLILGTLQAQEIEPRAYTNIPTGLSALALTYSWSQGNVLSDATAPIKDLNVKGHTPAVVYVYIFNFYGRLAKNKALLPFTHFSGKAEFIGQDTSGTRTGFNDARLRLSFNLFGSQAQSLKAFKRIEKEDYSWCQFSCVDAYGSIQQNQTHKYRIQPMGIQTRIRFFTSNGWPVSGNLCGCLVVY